MDAATPSHDPPGAWMPVPIVQDLCYRVTMQKYGRATTIMILRGTAANGRWPAESFPFTWHATPSACRGVAGSRTEF